jgi:gamma-glutamyltranspeptidase/glutathione hydrolase
MLDYGLDPQEAIDCPRVFFEGNELLLEQSVPAATALKLKDMGHRTSWREEPWGGGQMIAFDHVNGTLTGASDPRKDGLALGY